MSEASRLRAAGWYLKSLQTLPWYWPAARRLVMIGIPGPLVAWLRKLLGRPDWRTPALETETTDLRLQPAVPNVVEERRTQPS